MVPETPPSKVPVVHINSPSKANVKTERHTPTKSHEPHKTSVNPHLSSPGPRIEEGCDILVMKKSPKTSVLTTSLPKHDENTTASKPHLSSPRPTKEDRHGKLTTKKSNIAAEDTTSPLKHARGYHEKNSHAESPVQKERKSKHAEEGESMSSSKKIKLAQGDQISPHSAKENVPIKSPKVSFLASFNCLLY